MAKSLAGNLKDGWIGMLDQENAYYGVPVSGETQFKIDTFGELAQRTFSGKNPPYDDGQIEYIKFLTERIAYEMAATGIEHMSYAMSGCQSPIEKTFIAAFWTVAVHRGISGLGTATGGIPSTVIDDEIQFGTPFAPDSVTIEPQAKIGTYRVDFRITRMHSYYSPEGEGKVAKKVRRREIIVECDGHDFHEKTKEQAAKDKSRDRDLQSVGYHVFHFTGSEIWNRPVQCATEVYDWLEAWPEKSAT